jgi:cytosine/adenosine deaminase-related metal-dependent hydrolase
MGGRLLIRAGVVVPLDDDLSVPGVRDVLIEDDRIAAVAPQLSCDDGEDCETIDADGMIVLPGLVDSHRHLWYSAMRGDAMDRGHASLRADLWPRVALHYSPHDVFIATLAAAVECLNAGITCVFDWCHIVNTPEHAEAAIEALRSVPIRAVFGYGVSMRRKLDELAGPQPALDWSHARRLFESARRSSGGLVTLALALQGPEATSWDNTVSDIRVAREMGVPMSMHVGIPQGVAPQRGVARLHGAEMLGPDMNFVHCNALSDEEIARIGEGGATATLTPMAELALGMGIPPAGRFRRAGVRFALGADAVCSASGDLFDEARTVLLSDRMLNAQAIHACGRAVGSDDDLGMTTAEALAAITREGARACWLDATTGSIAPGKQADVILVRATDLNLAPAGDTVATIVGGAHAGNVDTVIVGGRVVKRAGRIQGIDTSTIVAHLHATRDRLDRISVT